MRVTHLPAVLWQEGERSGSDRRGDVLPWHISTPPHAAGHRGTQNGRQPHGVVLPCKGVRMLAGVREGYFA